MTNELKLAIRRLRGAPGFASVAIITLALAIGANTAIFSFADAVLFRPLPYEDPDRVFNVRMMLVRTGQRYSSVPVSHLALADEGARSLLGVGLLERTDSQLVATASGAEWVGSAGVTANYFELLGVRARYGRLLNAADLDASGQPAVVTWASFQRRFGGDGSVVGTPVTLGDRVYDLVGVLPPGFLFPRPFPGAIEIITLMPPISVASASNTIFPIVRLAPGATVPQAEAEVAALVDDLVSDSAAEDAALPVLDEVHALLYPTGAPVMRFLLTAAGLVLLIGCANLANMLLARTRLREREIGVQAALGATRAARVRPLLYEALIIGIAGGALALMAAAIGFEGLRRQVPAAAIAEAPVGVDLRVAVFSLGLGLVSGLVFSAAPALRASRLDALALMRSGGERSGRRSIGRPLLAAQVGLAIVLVFGAVIATRALVAVLSVPLGFDPDNVATVRVGAPFGDGLERQNMVMRAIDALEARPEVVSAGGIGSIPFLGGRPDEGIRNPVTGEYLNAGVFHVLPGYFETAGIELIRGRLPSRTDATSGAEVAVVTPAAGRSLFGDADPIGRTFTTSGGRRPTVVGVVREIVQSLASEFEPAVYIVPGPNTRIITIVARVRAPGDRILEEVRREVSTMVPGVPITASWWDDSIAAATEFRNPRFQTLVLGSFATLALGLTALGVFGLMAFLVASRMRDLGIRLAIGASPGSLTVHSIGHILAPTLAGVALGLVASRGLARLAETQLYEVDTNDPMTLVTAVAAVAIAALGAAYFPARRAARVDPMTVLRME